MSEADIHIETARWLRFAAEDFREAQELLKRQNFVPRHACWLAQQAAEKTLKAALIFLHTDYPRRHDLDALRNLLPPTWNVAKQCPRLGKLTEWAVESRYPGAWQEASIAEAAAAVEQAEQ